MGNDDRFARYNNHKFSSVMILGVGKFHMSNNISRKYHGNLFKLEHFSNRIVSKE